jgi:hypothetical protein
MRCLLSLQLVYLLPLQSFAASYERLQMDSAATTREQGKMPCYDGVKALRLSRMDAARMKLPAS